MKKILILLLVLSLLWIVKISFDIFQMKAQQEEINNNLHRVEQLNANLNDQFVALQRQIQPDVTLTQTSSENKLHAKTDEAILEVARESIQPTVLIRQQLDLIEFALQQQQYQTALNGLGQLDLKLAQYPLATSLKESLHDVIAKDRQAVQQFVIARKDQQTQIRGLIEQIDSALTKELNYTKLTPSTENKTHFWQRWITVEKVEQPSKALMQRDVILKEAQLRLLIAEQALLQGQYSEYQKSINEIIVLLQTLPDQQAQQFIQNLKKLKTITVIQIPHLNTRAIIG